MIDEHQLSRMVKEWILQHGQAPDAAPVSDEVNLLDTGVLDSMGFIELLGYIQTVTGQKIDLFELDPSAFTSIRGLIRHLQSVETQ
jgi:acyl carrier protein